MPMFSTSTHQETSTFVSYVNYAGHCKNTTFTIDSVSRFPIIPSRPIWLGKWRKDNRHNAEKETASYKLEANRLKTGSHKQTGGQYATKRWLPAIPTRQRNGISSFLFQKADRFPCQYGSSTRFCSQSIQGYCREDSSRTFTGSGTQRYCKSLGIYHKPLATYPSHLKFRDGSIFKKSSTQNANDNRITEVTLLTSLTKPCPKVRKSGLVFIWCKVRDMAHQLLGLAFYIFSSLPNNTFPIPANGRII